MIEVFEYSLVRHPNSPSPAIDRIDVRIEHPARGALVIVYTLIGRITDIILPALVVPERRDGLWQSTCFEVFFRTADEAHYTEHNFSPSTAWAAYAFDAYRSGMRELDVDAPFMERDESNDAFTLSVTIPVNARFASHTTRMALSAVVVARDGTKSYWALAHPAGAPDFHHADCFVAELAPSIVS